MTDRSADYRQDIQALRGLAVLLVLFYHAKLGVLTAGYLGVDIFFVISGFLITGIVKRQIEEGRFSLADFYARRARRLLPAAYVTFLCTTIAAGLLLTNSEFRDYQNQLLGSLVFAGNIALWMQTGYFDGAAHYKPLLHVWSLAIEEQYYLLLPAVLLIFPRKTWRSGCKLVFFLSLALCFWLSYHKPGATFYFLPTRAWELALGSLGAMLSLSHGGRKVFLRLYWPSIATLVIVPFAPTRLVNGWFDVLLVCLATLCVILADKKVRPFLGAMNLLTFPGQISYSLYLVHWPLFTFINNTFVSDPPLAIRVLILFFSVILGMMLHFGVEKPARYVDIAVSKRTVGAVAVLSMLLAGLAYLPLLIGNRNQTYTLADNTYHGLDASCLFEDNFLPAVKCSTSENPKIMVWGDSLAIQLIPGLSSVTDAGILQATKTFCGPVLSQAPFDYTTHPRAWAEDCLAFNNSVVEYLKSTPSIDTVILASLFEQYMDVDSGVEKHGLLVSTASGIIAKERSSDEAMLAMIKTIQMIRNLGKKVILVAPPPVANFDVGKCVERRLGGYPVFGYQGGDCSIPYQEYKQSKQQVAILLARLEEEARVQVIRFDEIFCDERKCITQSEGRSLYADSMHLTTDGSRLAFINLSSQDLASLIHPH